MKTFLLFLIVGIAPAFASDTYSQVTRLSVDLKNVSIEELFKVIEENSEYIFFYKESVPVDAKVSVTMKNETLDQILNKVLPPRMSYQIINRQVVVTENPAPQPVAAPQAAQQSRKITGVVTDSKGEPLIGVSVLVKETSTGTITDIDGRFSLDVAPANAVLEFSYIGYSKSTATVTAAQKEIRVTMQEDAQTIEEVVVVGYGVQKKVNLTGAVSMVGSDKLANRPAMNLASTLDGLAPGVRVTQSSGNPGDEKVSILIRGTGSFNESSPLVLVDGVQADMSVLNSDDVESVSVLKDAASAAIYGSRAANGVILVTTKKGKKEAPRVTFSAIFAQEKANTDLKFMSSTADFMELHNMAKYNANPKTEGPDYKPETIADWRKANADPNGLYTDPATGNQIPNWLAYPNTDWAQVMFQPTYYQKYNVGISGGSDVSSYMLSLGYQSNPGTLENTGLQRFNMRANVETKVAGFITVGTQTYATKEFKDPGNVDMSYLLQAFTAMTPKYNGLYGASEDPYATTSNNVLVTLAGTGGQNTYTRINTSWYVNVELPLKGLVGEAKFNYSEYKREDEQYTKSIGRYSFRESFETPKLPGTTLANATSYRYAYGSSSYTADLILRYNNTFGKHEVGGLFGYEQYRTESSGFSATKKGLLDWEVTDISSASEILSIGTADKNEPKTEYAMISYFGRANYAYDGKYMLEANFRSDQSSKFAPGHRGNIFPSVSAGWRISEESFFQPLKNTVNYLKLKASYGILGNTVSGNYDWQATYKKVNYIFNEKISPGVVQATIQNQALSWEKLTTYNFGLEASFLDQRLFAELDVYYRKTSDILAKGKIYTTMGNVTPPMENTASMGNKGIDLSLKWNDNVGKVRYGIGLTGTYNTNEVTDFRGALKYELDNTVLDVWGKPTMRYTNLGDVATYDGNNYRVEGKMIDEYFLRKPYNGNGTYYNADGSVNPNGGPNGGMIRTKADLEWVKAMMAAGYDFNSQKVGPNATNIWYGTMIFADANGDGRYGNNDDREFTGKSTMPKFTFGLTLTADWKGIDLSMIWSGRLGSYHYLNDRGANSSIISDPYDALPADAWNMYYSYDAIKAQADADGGAAYDPATDPTANIGGKYPRLLTASSNMVANTFYLYNTSFVKLRSLQIGYTFPKNWVSKAKINNLRVFFTGENLLTIKSGDFPGVDPELGSSISVYPISRMYSGGISLTF